MPILDESIENACLHIRRQTSNAIFEQFYGTQCKEKQYDIIKGIKGVEYIEQFVVKNLNKELPSALDYKNQGNQEFKQCRWDAALELYNKSVICMPGNTSNLAIVLGNRSAVLFNMKEYQLAVNDINAALPMFPNENLFKLVHRKAKCLFELSQFTEAYEAFEKSEVLIQSNYKIPPGQKLTLLNEIKLMKKYLRRNCSPYLNQDALNGNAEKSFGSSDDLYVNNSMEIAYNKLEGRHAMCCQPIEAGEVILEERPYASVLSKAHAFTHCQNCLKRTNVPIACDSCRDIVFCSQICKDRAIFHKYECGILESMWKSKSDMATHLSIRMITSKNPTTLLKYKEKLECNGGSGVTNGHSNGNSNGNANTAPIDVYSLLTHESEFTKEKLFEFMLMAKFQLECIKAGGYPITVDDNFIVSLLYQNILILHFNAHEIFELQKDNDSDAGKTVCIGAAIYPFLAQFNHSCDPTTVRYFDGNRVIIRATRNIISGEHISENYGPIFTQDPKSERQLQLKEKYKFECRCDACTNDWPLLKQMIDSMLPAKCHGKNGTCGNILMCNELTTKIFCSECKHETDVMEIIKFIKQVEVNLDKGKHLFDANQVSDALDIYLKLIKDMDKHIKPPFSKWHICQKRIRSVYLEYGNKVNFKLAPNNTDTNYFM